METLVERQQELAAALAADHFIGCLGMAVLINRRRHQSRSMIPTPGAVVVLMFSATMRSLQT
ncbi:hypothetical protein AB0392_03140 [Nonomuraea angiospora]|uniref:hypothetical protein n=1 Tax=Nonomuraea angiospora TaxID=46172 RepID=UPI0034504C54